MNNYKIELKWGLIFSAMSVLWMLIEKLTGLHDDYIDHHKVYTNFIAIPAIAIYVFAFLDKRRNYYGGKMTYMQGFMCGLFITGVVTILSPLTQIITTKLITPGYFQAVINYSVKIGEMTREQAEEYFTLKNYIIQGLIGAPVMGILTSAIVAIFTRKN